MHIVIMGCGRVGSSIAHSLEDQGHSVAVIDQDPEAFRKLRSGFQGDQGHRHRLRPGRTDRSRHRAGGGVRGCQQRRQLQRDRRQGSQGVLRRAAGGRAHLRSPPRRGVPAAWHPDGRDRGLDRRSDAAQAAARGRRVALARSDRRRGAGRGRLCRRLDRREGLRPGEHRGHRGSRSSPDWARPSSPARAWSCRKATWCTSSPTNRVSAGIAAVFANPAPGRGAH